MTRRLVERVARLLGLSQRRATSAATPGLRRREVRHLSNWLYSMHATEHHTPPMFVDAARRWLLDGELHMPDGALPVDPLARHMLPVPLPQRAKGATR